ncbi:MAG: 3-dehydroquinate synthase [Ignavibacteriales bacterium]|nr:3-dehydroquinate synthase [Ignavibacteriales bacterium]
MNKIKINLKEKSYPVYFGENIFSKIPELNKSLNLSKNIFLVVDGNVLKHHRRLINGLIEKFDTGFSFIEFHADEESKSYESLNKIYSAMLAKGYSRDTLLIAIGGGITGDIAGFAAATFARGIQYVHVPTTLLAMVDSSVGGKTGINFGDTKNIVGAFYQPKYVLIDSVFLKTLPQDETICGIGEIVKYGLLIGDDFFNVIEKKYTKLIQCDKSTVNKIVQTCVQFKASIVENDEMEISGLRKVLNIGHTFAHAIEVEQKHKIKHGQAVIVGLACALHLSNKMNLLNDDELQKYLSLIIKLAGKIKIAGYDPNKLYEIMKRDKKNRADVINFVLLKKAGSILVDIEAARQDVFYALNNGIQYFVN